MRCDSRITVIGGGNIGTQLACVCAAKGYSVTVLSSRPERYTGVLEIVDAKGDLTCRGRLDRVTDKLYEAMDAEVIFVTYPAYMFPILAADMEPYLRPGQCIGCLPGTGGAEFTFRRCVEKGAVLFGLQRVPAVARLVEYGKRVCVEGKRDALHLAAFPGSRAPELSAFMAELFDMPCHPLPNYLSVTLTPSNPLLHTVRLATLFEDYVPGKVYPRNPLFYGEWSNASSERLLMCDAEHQGMLKMLDEMDLTAVKSLVEHYDNSDTPEKMTKKISGIQSLCKLLSPMKETEGGFVPDFDSRYFTADFPYGLAILEQFANILGAPAPMIREIMRWYRDMTGNRDGLDLCAYGIRTKADIYEFYKRVKGL